MAVDLIGTKASREDAAALKAVFATITANSCPQFFNFHMHTVCSDGRLEPEQLIQQATQLGLQGLAITDHHSIHGYQRAKRWLEDYGPQTQQPLPQLWIGAELNAALLTDEVHILAYAFIANHDALSPYLGGMYSMSYLATAAQVIDAIHQAGGLAVLAHPARYRRSHRELIAAAVELGIDGIEAYYAYDNPSPWRPSPRQTQEVVELGNHYQLLQTCGTDSHGLSLLKRV